MPNTPPRKLFGRHRAFQLYAEDDHWFEMMKERLGKKTDAEMIRYLFDYALGRRRKI